MNNSFAELVYRITGKVVDDSLEITTNEGTTYNFLERPAPYKLNLSVGKDVSISPSVLLQTSSRLPAPASAGRASALSPGYFP